MTREVVSSPPPSPRPLPLLRLLLLLPPLLSPSRRLPTTRGKDRTVLEVEPTLTELPESPGLRTRTLPLERRSTELPEETGTSPEDEVSPELDEVLDLPLTEDPTGSPPDTSTPTRSSSRDGDTRTVPPSSLTRRTEPPMPSPTFRPSPLELLLPSEPRTLPRSPPLRRRSTRRSPSRRRRRTTLRPTPSTSPPRLPPPSRESLLSPSESSESGREEERPSPRRLRTTTLSSRSRRRLRPRRPRRRRRRRSESRSRDDSLPLEETDPLEDEEELEEEPPASPEVDSSDESSETEPLPPPEDEERADLEELDEDEEEPPLLVELPGSRLRSSMSTTLPPSPPFKSTVSGRLPSPKTRLLNNLFDRHQPPTSLTALHQPQCICINLPPSSRLKKRALLDSLPSLPLFSIHRVSLHFYISLFFFLPKPRFLFCFCVISKLEPFFPSSIARSSFAFVPRSCSFVSSLRLAGSILESPPPFLVPEGSF
ncbi:hypothetical protein BDY24DRAFT_404634 [Mrakia frigida]|uniref:uncharacterized protein n=1 Tax=Mrakia frigida TaxID=29902 RepID=UPI003FCBFF7D